MTPTIICHRGLWEHEGEKNTVDAFRRALQEGFGIETDVRDAVGELVISHDPPKLKAVTFEWLVREVAEYENRVPLAINVKADGLGPTIKAMLDHYGVTNYFCFDMSIPETLAYLNAGLNVYWRQSDAERDWPITGSKGVWMDSFFDQWFTEGDIESYLANDLSLCVVSPELHGRDYKQTWETVKAVMRLENAKLMLCTDHPREAQLFFKETA